MPTGLFLICFYLIPSLVCATTLSGSSVYPGNVADNSLVDGNTAVFVKVSDVHYYTEVNGEWDPYPKRRCWMPGLVVHHYFPYTRTLYTIIILGKTLLKLNDEIKVLIRTRLQMSPHSSCDEGGHYKACVPYSIADTRLIFKCTPEEDRLEEGRSVIVRINVGAKQLQSEISEIKFNY